MSDNPPFSDSETLTFTYKADLVEVLARAIHDAALNPKTPGDADSDVPFLKTWTAYDDPRTRTVTRNIARIQARAAINAMFANVYGSKGL